MSRKILIIIAAGLLCRCAHQSRLIGTPPGFLYSSINGAKIAFATPIVASSEIFYENRFTDQNYHSIDKSRTRDAFFRDFAQKVKKSGLPWRRLSQGADSTVQALLASVNATIDSLPRPVVRRLGADTIDMVVLVYAMHLYHQQSIGLRPDKTGSVNSYTSIINRVFDFRCSIIDLQKNKPVFSITVKKSLSDNSLDMMERAIDDLFGVILR